MEQEKNKMEQGKSKQQRMRELVELLNRARKAYEQDNTEIMSNYEYDRLYDELEELEKELGTKMANSPTVNVGYEVVSGLPKERHERPMLSLDKTKEVERLKEFLGTKKAMISWKLDGLTIVLTYQGGELVKAVTRGNGIEGEVITNNAKVFQNVPLHIPYQGELVLRGEAVISYKDFEAINEKIEDVDAKYKNPRNLCSGSVRQLNNEITAKRNVKFFAFTLVRAEEVDFHNSRMYQMQWLKEQGFDVVEHHPVTAETIEEEVAWFAKAIGKNEIPSDGLVLVYDDIAYGQSLGTTAKFPRDSFAFKWADEIRETTLLEIEWSPSRTGLINPVAVFEPVELEGTTVSRASVHNISIMEELELGVGDTIQVYKANMIIPQIAENLTRSGVKDIPTVCPVCGGTTKISMENETKTLFCTNPECQAKHVKAFSLFVSRDAMNIEGLSEATLDTIKAMGTRMRKVEERLLAMEKTVRPQPLKKPLRQNIKHTRIKSKLKERRYSVLPAITAASLVKMRAKKAGQSCTSTKQATPKHSDRRMACFMHCLARFCLPAPIFCATIAARAAEKAVGGSIVKVLILPTTPSAAEAMTPIWLTMAVINKKEIFTSVSWKDTGSPKRSRVETFSRYKRKLLGLKSNKNFLRIR